jgi:hypothetical protein
MLLRILYIKDLRSLQSSIDRILVQVQVSAIAVHQAVNLKIFFNPASTLSCAACEAHM